jgi:glyoxylase-like metal-dependent hydrolase (beta-lactamase superfamily II)
MLGDVVQLADNLWFIHGEMPKDASKAPDWRNVVIYRSANRLYLIDSGGGSAIRSSIQRILSEVGEVESFTLINSHGHLDHICNNDVVSSTSADRKRHLLRREAIEFVKSDFSASWRTSSITSTPTSIPSRVIRRIGVFIVLQDCCVKGWATSWVVSEF